MAAIDKTDVEIGTVLTQGYNHTLKFAKVVRLTRTQAVCQHMRENGELYGKELRVKLNWTDRWGHRRNGGLEIGTGDFWDRRIWRVTINLEGILERKRQADAKRKAKVEKRQAVFDREWKERIDLMVEGYENRTCLNENLGVWSMTFDYPDSHQSSGPIVLTWTAKEGTEFSYADHEERQIIKVWGSAWRFSWGEPNQRTFSGEGATELAALSKEDYS